MLLDEGGPVATGPITLHNAQGQTGELSLSSDGSFTFAPEEGATGEFTAFYRVSEGPRRP